MILDMSHCAFQHAHKVAIEGQRPDEIDRDGGQRSNEQHAEPEVAQRRGGGGRAGGASRAEEEGGPWFYLDC